MKKKFLFVLPMILTLVGCGGGNTSSVAATSSATSTSSTTTTSSVAASSTEASSVAASSAEATSSVEETSSSADPSDDTFKVQAEYSPDIEFYTGPGFSGTGTGAEIIIKDSKGAFDTDNGYYISYLYKYGAEMNYTINSTADISNVTLKWRISAEFFNNQTYTMTDNQIMINGSLLTYAKISFTDVPAQTSGQSKPFEDYTVSTNVSLKKGDNVLKYMTANTTAPGGTMTATAPIIDCFKFSNLSGATLTFTDAVTDYATLN